MENMRFEKNNFIFDYILPLRKDCLLVEVTSFSKMSLSAKKLEILIEKTLKGNNIKILKLLEKSMVLFQWDTLIKIYLTMVIIIFMLGSVGGAVRPSSGYAF